MHQTVRQFFLRPHDAVVRSTFHAVANAQGSQMMIRLTCVRYLKLHYNEVVLKFRESEDNYTYQNACKFVQYLNLRPFIKYSLEFLQLANEDMDPYATQPLSDLMNSIRKSPPLPALCLLRRPADRKADSCKIQQQLNHFLLIASEKGYCFAVGNLLAAAASCESIEKSGPGWTPLHLAANNGHEATVRQLLDFGADIKAKDNAHQTPLHLAASKCHNATIQQLLKRGADIEAKDDSYRTPLILAVSNKHKTTVQLLLRLGADIDAESIFRQSALSLAASKGQEFTVRLLRLGAKIEAKDTFGRTPLYLAAMKGQNATIKLLLDHGANIEAQDDYFRTPLFWPTLEQRISTIQLLLDYGADSDARGGVYRDPLWKSATIGHRPTIQLLLSRGRPGAGPH